MTGLVLLGLPNLLTLTCGRDSDPSVIGSSHAEILCARLTSLRGICTSAILVTSYLKILLRIMQLHKQPVS